MAIRKDQEAGSVVSAMARETKTVEQFWAELEGLGEQEVRIRLAKQVFGTVGDKKAVVEEWLRHKERSREAASNAEQTEIARSAKDAAWAAAEAARDAATQAKTANTRATIALVIAAISAIAAIIALLIPK
jgi:hypothetical protein